MTFPKDFRSPGEFSHPGTCRWADGSHAGGCAVPNSCRDLLPPLQNHSAPPELSSAWPPLRPSVACCRPPRPPQSLQRPCPPFFTRPSPHPTPPPVHDSLPLRSFPAPHALPRPSFPAFLQRRRSFPLFSLTPVVLLPLLLPSLSGSCPVAFPLLSPIAGLRASTRHLICTLTHDNHGIAYPPRYK